VVLAAFLFGFLFQGGAELGLWTKIPIEMRIVVQGLVILFTGALDMMVRMLLVRIFALFRRASRGPRDGLRHASATSGLDPAAGDAAAAGLHRRAVFRTLRRLRHRARGKMLVAAMCAGAVAYVGIGLDRALAGIGGSLVFAAIHGVASITFRGNQLISGVALNFLASGLTVLVAQSLFGQGGRTPPLDGDGAVQADHLPFAEALQACRSSAPSITR
jgi:ABC-type uncharacterized transport system permease subunit